MNIKHLLLGSIAALCLFALPAAAHAFNPGQGTETITAPDIASFSPSQAQACHFGDEVGLVSVLLGDDVGIGPSQAMALKEIDVFTGPQHAGPKDGKAVKLAGFLRANNPMPQPKAVASRTKAPGEGGGGGGNRLLKKPIVVITLAEGWGGVPLDGWAAPISKAPAASRPT